MPNFKIFQYPSLPLRPNGEWDFFKTIIQNPKHFVTDQENSTFSKYYIRFLGAVKKLKSFQIIAVLLSDFENNIMIFNNTTLRLWKKGHNVKV